VQTPVLICCMPMRSFKKEFKENMGIDAMEIQGVEY
jgi:hypothetical protein